MAPGWAKRLFTNDSRNLCDIRCFLILAAKDPVQHLSLIWFTVWSSIVHGGIMAIQALYYPQHFAHLYGDVPALFIIAIVLAILTPRHKAP